MRGDILALRRRLAVAREHDIEPIPLRGETCLEHGQQQPCIPGKSAIRTSRASRAGPRAARPRRACDSRDPEPRASGRARPLSGPWRASARPPGRCARAKRRAGARPPKARRTGKRRPPRASRWIRRARSWRASRQQGSSRRHIAKQPIEGGIERSSCGGGGCNGQEIRAGERAGSPREARPLPRRARGGDFATPSRRRWAGACRRQRNHSRDRAGCATRLRLMPAV